MSVTEFKTDGSRREFDNHFKRKTKWELIHELWDCYGHIQQLQARADLAARR